MLRRKRRKKAWIMFTEVPLFPEQATTHAGHVDTLFFFLLGVSGFFSALIAILLIFFAIKYRRRSANERPQPIHSSLVLELTWSLIPLGITVFTFVWGAQLFFRSARPPEDVMEVYVVGKQWMWKVQHGGGQREINQLHVPVGRPVKLTMISQDVIHSFFVPAFRIHQDVLPNRYTTVWFEATKPGKYHLFCSQYCGTNHAKMIGEVIVMPKEEFAIWLNQGPDGSMASEGRKLFLKLQCVACHSADAGARGPVLEGLYGAEVTLRDGRRLRADDAYLRESIVNPDAKIVAGFQPIMPSYAGQVDEEEMLQLLAFIKGLRPGQTPRRTQNAEPP
jgi:cytochrome c oxidase subunit 2